MSKECMKAKLNFNTMKLCILDVLCVYVHMSTKSIDHLVLVMNTQYVFCEVST
jgi:hypothetical protein